MASNSRVSSKPGRGAVLAQRLGLLVVAFALAYVLASMVGFSPSDPPSHTTWVPGGTVANWCGPLGAVISYTLFKMLGLGAWVLVGLAFVAVFAGLCGQLPKHLVLRGIGAVLLSACIAGLQQLILPSSGPFPDLAGGLVGVVGVHELRGSIGGVGAGIALFAGLLIGAIVAMDEWLTAAFGWTWNWAREKGVPAAASAGAVAGSAALAASSTAAKASGGVLADLWTRLFKPSAGRVREHDLDDSPDEEAASAKPSRRGRSRKADKSKAEQTDEDLSDIEDPDITAANADDEPTLVVDEDEDAEMTEEEEDDDAPAPSTAKSEVEAKPARGKAAERKGAARAADGDEDEDAEDDESLPGAPQVFTEDQLREKVAKLPVFFGAKNKTVATDADLATLQNAAAANEEKTYRFPALDLLEQPEENFNTKLEESVREQAAALVAALQQFRIDGEVDSIESGPVITLFHVRLRPGTKVAQLETVSKDIARVLKSQNIRIVPNMAGRDTVGIEVPNLTKERVRLKELMGKTEKFSGMKLPMFLGKDASGEPLIEDLAKMPHMLIAGTTGSGKSVCMNTIIMSFLFTKKPSELKMVLVDPKMVEMSQFKDIPHLMCPVVTEMSKAAAILEWATQKMDERYELLAEAGCRDIAAYNDLPWEELKERFGELSPEEEARIPRKLPYMVFIIDELADLMMTNKEVEGHIIRIAQKARAVGIHLILATQRPQANVVTGLIKSNMPCRVAFKVASGTDSRIVLDQKGGELLLGHGDMLFLSPRSSKLTRAQGTLVDDMEIRKVVKFMREVAGPSFERQLMQLRRPSTDGSGLGNLTDEERALASANNSSASLAAAQEDPLFPSAVEVVLETRRGSVSLLQRRLAIGYTRASRLIDLMGIAGIISEHKGSVARDVLIGAEEWAAMKQLAADEARTKGVNVPSLGVGEEQGELFEAENATQAEEAASTDEEADAEADDEEGEVEEDLVDEAEVVDEADEEVEAEEEDTEEAPWEDEKPSPKR